MNADYMLVGGLLAVILSIPSLLTAYSSSEPPRMGAVLIILGLGMIWYASSFSGAEYTWQDVPNVFFRVLGELW